MAPSLAEIQAAMTASILERSNSIPEDWLRLPDGVDAKQRVAVYVEGYPARVHGAIRESHPAIANILGAGTFAAMCDRYIAQLEAPHRNLNDIGSALACFLAADALLGSLPFLCELAELEWAIHRCFHSRPLEPFDVSRCSAWDIDRWEHARIQLQPEVSIVRSEWPLRALRAAKDLDRDSIDIDLQCEAETLWVRRSGLEVVVECISELEADTLERFRAGHTLGEVTEAIAEAGADEDAVTRLFSRWNSLGLVTRCD